MPPGRSPDRVELRLESGEEWGHNQQVGADGTFLFEHVKAGTWELHRVREGKLWTMESAAGDDPAKSASSGKLPYPSMEVVITSGRTTHADFDLRVAIPCVLELDVTNNLTPAAGWSVIASNRYSQQTGPASASVDTQGHARIEVEDPGPCWLKFKPAWGQPEFVFDAQVTLQRGANSLRQEIPTARLEGTVEGWRSGSGIWWSLRRTESREGSSGSSNTVFYPDGRGHFEIVHLKPGPVEIVRTVVKGEDRHEETVQSLDLIAGETKVLRLQ
jgi:hypothetical protein